MAKRKQFFSTTTGSGAGGTALSYGLDDRRLESRQGFGIFSLHHRIQTGSGVHPASYPMGTKGYFSGSKATEA
jgi:hypothetical protein